MLQQTEHVSMVEHSPYVDTSTYQGSFLPHFDVTPIPAQSKPLQLLLKHAFDFTATVLFLLVLSPLMLLVAVLIKATSRGRVIFKHQRAGLYGKVITVYKFRTMVHNAEELAPTNIVNGVFAAKDSDDERVTPIGAFLRRSSIDELPQLFNVLKGEMSLVGPRPLSLFEHQKTYSWQIKRLQMRPGITCIWQVSGRNTIMDERRLQMDVDYIDKWSLWLDAKILLKTIPVVISGKGAR